MKYFLTIISFLLPATFIKAQNVLYIQPGATIKTTGGAIVTLDNVHLENNGSISQIPGDGVFRFTGNANTTISGSSVTQLSILQLAKTGAANLSLAQQLRISEQVNFQSGLLDMMNHNIMLLPTALLENESENSRITASQSGDVSILVALNAPLSANPGNLGAIISSPQNLGFTIIRRGHLSQTNGGGGGNSILRHYDILPVNNTNLNATLRLHYFDAELNGLAENTLTLWKSPDNTNWVNMGFAARDAATNYAEQNGLTDFSRWTLSSIGNTLPVHFILFNTNCSNNLVTLVWKTAQEQNSKYFDILKSTDGINFASIATQHAAGNSSTEKIYTYTDSNTLPGTFFYRIAQTDADGRKQYTGINRTNCITQLNDVQAWPNPVQQQLFLRITARLSSIATIKLFDSKGSVVLARQQHLLQGNNQLSINTSNLAAGIYSLTVNWNKGKNQQVLKMIKQ